MASANCVAKRRLGFTLIELLVVVAIISVLVAMLLPALNGARAAAKKVGCINNLRSLHLAATFYAEDHAGRVPACPNLTAAMPNSNWCLPLAPYLGYTGGPIDFFSPPSLGSLEIRTTRSYKTLADTTTREPNPFFCPAARGRYVYPTAGVYSWTGNGVWGDYGMNRYIAGIILASGAYDSIWKGRRLQDVRPADKIVLFGDTWLVTAEFGNLGKNAWRHLERCNMVFVDGHVESDIVIGTNSGGIASTPEANLEAGDPPSWTYAGGYRNIKYFVTPEP